MYENRYYAHKAEKGGMMDDKFGWLIFIPDSISALNVNIVPERSERYSGFRYLTPDEARALVVRLVNLADFLDDKISAAEFEGRNPFA